jgi:hypothetical protein
LPVGLYRYETWFFVRREEHTLKVFENRVLRKIFGRRRERVRGGWGKLHSEGNFMSKWAGRVAPMGEKHFGGETQRRDNRLEELGIHWRIILTRDFNELGVCSLAQDRYTWRAVVNLVISPRFP